MAKGKLGNILVKLLSTAGTGYFYVKARARPAARAPLRRPSRPCRRPQKKNPKKLPGKLEFMKYDPRVMKHVLFSEVKLK